MEKLFENVAIVLVRPAGPLNIGSAARAMKNTGFQNLVLVDPPNYLTKEAFDMAVTSRNILEGARPVRTLDEALADRHTTFGVTARARHKRPRLWPAEAAKSIRDLLAQGQKVALVFGPEDQGLSTEETEHCAHLIGIPAHSGLITFNLAQAVLLVCHALFMQGEPVLEEKTKPDPATHEDRQRIEERARDLLKRYEYLTPNRRFIVRDLLKRIVYRSPLETRDVRDVLAIIRHLNIKRQT